MRTRWRASLSAIARSAAAALTLSAWLSTGLREAYDTTLAGKTVRCRIKEDAAVNRNIVEQGE